jgi:hypothetical protein
LDRGQGGYKIMASNFKLFSHRNRDSIHLQMYGDFDANSAHEVINSLKNYGTTCVQIFIDTNYLSKIHPFGLKVFQNHFYTCNQKYNGLIFLGKHKHSFLYNGFY